MMQPTFLEQVLMAGLMSMVKYQPFMRTPWCVPQVKDCPEMDAQSLMAETVFE
ncbi:hypothetical protein [Vibrio tetraodonis]|uniref:hypothetical protein n=1 Tax=Vibrio tetraodonis TaxID=2231647 RepID=UPI0013B3C59F|nr:hypothetical protein [Vibrio tetraodonis]